MAKQADWGVENRHGWGKIPQPQKPESSNLAVLGWFLFWHGGCFTAVMKKLLTAIFLGFYILLISLMTYGKVSTKVWEHQPEAEAKYHAYELEHKLYVP